MTRVLIVEDQRALAEALQIAIDAQPDLECVGVFGTVEDALPMVDAAGPDVVLMDIHLPGLDGIEGTKRVRAARPEARVLILTGDATPHLLAAAATAGAAGFLAKDGTLGDVLTAIRAPVAGKIIVEGASLAGLLERLGPRADENSRRQAGSAGLTPRELEVLALMGDGLDPKAIARHLLVSLHTARGHVKNVMRKLDAHTQLEAVVAATRSGLLHPPHSPAR